MPQIIPTKKLYHERRGKPSPIGNVGRLLTSGQIVPTNKGGGKPLSSGGNRPPRGGGDGLPKGGGNGPLRDQNP